MEGGGEVLGADIPRELRDMAMRLCDLSRPEGAVSRSWEEMEGPIVELCQQMGQWALQRALRGHPQAAEERKHRCPQCGKRLRILRSGQKRTVRSRVGAVSYDRPYGTCDHCRLSGAPMDWELGVEDVAVSVGLLERVCHGAVVGRSFEDAEEILKVQGGVDLSAKRIRVLAEREGRRLGEERRQRVRGYRSGEAQGVVEGPGLLVVCADGGRVQTRQKEADERWKEDKIGVVYDAVAGPAVGRVEAGKYKGAKAKVKTYVATMTSWEEFGWMLREEAQGRGYEGAREKVFVADGARTIRELQKFHFPEATFVLDWVHATQHVADCAKAAFGEGTEAGNRWYLAHRQMLWEGDIETLIRDVEALSAQAGLPREGDPEGSPRKVLSQNATSYFPNNREAMDYPRFRAKGWPIGSGVAEGAVKQFGLRMKGSEKFWNGLEKAPTDNEGGRTGAEEMLALCALYHCEDDRWRNYWKQRGQPIRWKPLTDEERRAS